MINNYANDLLFKAKSVIDGQFIVEWIDSGYF